MRYFDDEEKKEILLNRLDKEEFASGDKLRYVVTTVNGRPFRSGFGVRSFRHFEDASKYFDKQVALPQENNRHFKCTLRKVVTQTELLREVEK